MSNWSSWIAWKNQQNRNIQDGKDLVAQTCQCRISFIIWLLQFFKKQLLKWSFHYFPEEPSRSLQNDRQFFCHLSYIFPFILLSIPQLTNLQRVRSISSIVFKIKLNQDFPCTDPSLGRWCECPFFKLNLWAVPNSKPLSNLLLHLKLK